MENSKNMIAYIAIAVIVIGAGAAGYSFMSSQSAVVPATEQSENSEAGSSDTMEVDPENYVDGEYSAEGSYTSPAGEETVFLDLTLEDGIITDITFEGDAENDVSIKFQSQFAEGYKDMVLGKSINDVQLDKVSGSSLTAGGFNAAIEEIKQQAQS